MRKAELRKIFLEKRQSLTDADYAMLNRRICDNFFSLVDVSFIKILHTFLPIEKNREPDTWMIVDRIKREFPHVRISIPKINTETAMLDNFYFEGLHQLENNTWGIPEPRQGIPTPIDNIDTVLVPLLAFDMHGHRVGYGRGFYDKFLRACRPATRKIGLSFFPPVDRITDAGPHDLPLDMVVTPDEVVSLPRV